MANSSVGSLFAALMQPRGACALPRSTRLGLPLLALGSFTTARRDRPVTGSPRQPSPARLLAGENRAACEVLLWRNPKPGGCRSCARRRLHAPPSQPPRRRWPATRSPAVVIDQYSHPSAQTTAASAIADTRLLLDHRLALLNPRFAAFFQRPGPEPGHSFLRPSSVRGPVSLRVTTAAIRENRLSVAVPRHSSWPAPRTRLARASSERSAVHSMKRRRGRANSDTTCSHYGPG